MKVAIFGDPGRTGRNIAGFFRKTQHETLVGSRGRQGDPRLDETSVTARRAGKALGLL